MLSVCDTAAETFHLRTRKLTACPIRTKVFFYRKFVSLKMRAWGCEHTEPDFDSVWFCCCGSVTDSPPQFNSLCCWKLQIKTNSSESCMTVCDNQLSSVQETCTSMFVWFLNQWSDSAALKQLHCTVMSVDVHTFKQKRTQHDKPERAKQPC